MLKKSGSSRGNGAGGSSQAEMRLLKVKDVQPDGMVIEFTDGREGPTVVFMEATPSFVEQKNKSVNFAAKSTGDKMHEKFYLALMRPTTNPDHVFHKNVDIISAKMFARAGTRTVESYGELTKVGLGGGFTVFARGDSIKKDPFDETIQKVVKGDIIAQGMGRIVFDAEAENAATGKKGSRWLEVLTAKGNPESIDALADEIRSVISAKRGKNIFIRVVKEDGTNDLSASYYQGKDSKEVEDEIQELKDLNLPMERFFVWDIQPRIYLRDDFVTGQGEGASKLERFRRDAQYTYRIDPAKTPFEVNAIPSRNDKRRVPEDGYFVPVAVSQTLYQNATTGDEEWLPGAIRALVPIGATVLHSRQAYMTPAQRLLAESMAPDASNDQAPQAPEGSHAPVPQAESPSADLDFGFGDDTKAA
jgi:hypothetical protein